VDENTPEVNKEEHWSQKFWRPAMAWSYLSICLFDFMMAPIFFAVFAAVTKTPPVVWKSLTLAEGGLFHVAMGAILGISAFGRSQEKTARITADTTDNSVKRPTPLKTEERIG